MTIMITGASVPQSAALGTVVGYLHCYNCGETVPSNFVLCRDAAGLSAACKLHEAADHEFAGLANLRF